jgi:hypothetical protein
LRSIGPLPFLPVSESRSARPAGAFASFGQQRITGDSATIVPPQARPIRSLPFLAQYIAQEVMGPDEEATPRWAERDSAYRIASAADTDPARISIQA